MAGVLPAHSAPRLTAIVIGCVCVLTGPVAGAQQVTPLFDGKSLGGWTLDADGDARADVGVMTVQESTGWVRTNRVFDNFALTFEMRLLAPDAQAHVFVRAWPTFDSVSKGPNNAYRIRIGSSRSPDAAAPSPWQRVEITCIDRELTVRIDDKVAYTSEDLNNPQGHIAFAVSKAGAEFREIGFRVRSSALPRPPRNPGVFTPRESGATLPKPTREVKPRYTSDAMAARIQGAVLLSAVVLPTGTVEGVTVLQSLDPVYGLDRAAVDAAKDWRFLPGTKDGQPVPVEVTIQLTFTLR